MIDQEWEVSDRSVSSGGERYIKASISTWRVSFAAICDLCCWGHQPIKGSHGLENSFREYLE
jgi:hypothetical protein